jgi:hypothetical protein
MLALQSTLSHPSFLPSFLFLDPPAPGSTAPDSYAVLEGGRYAVSTRHLLQTACHTAAMPRWSG